MKHNETLTIEPVEMDENGRPDFDTDQLPTVELSKRDAKQLYHGIFRHDYAVELPDGSTGQLSIAPSEFERTPLAGLRRRWFWFKYQASERVGDWIQMAKYGDTTE